MQKRLDAALFTNADIIELRKHRQIKKKDNATQAWIEDFELPEKLKGKAEIPPGAEIEFDSIRGEL